MTMTTSLFLNSPLCASSAPQLRGSLLVNVVVVVIFFFFSVLYFFYWLEIFFWKNWRNPEKKKSLKEFCVWNVRISCFCLLLCMIRWYVLKYCLFDCFYLLRLYVCLLCTVERISGARFAMMIYLSIFWIIKRVQTAKPAKINECHGFVAQTRQEQTCQMACGARWLQ